MQPDQRELLGRVLFNQQVLRSGLWQQEQLVVEQLTLLLPLIQQLAVGLVTLLLVIIQQLVVVL